MYLKRLEIQGFKSFADKVDIDFNSGITVVVGPNGSGKSNVVDAIRWVLGEQSAKTLRGLRMDDVIFSGSNKRRPVGMAQVSLTLDNSSGMFPLDYQEVTVTRRLYRSGESEYLINKVSCRMKDIHQLFMDTGVGKEGFSVIGQGKIDEILSLRAEDRRNLIEEAAGIVKYRYRKKEAERKLEDTEQSILRIRDIVHELTEQLGPLEEQAAKAQKYQSWKKELDQLEISMAIHAVEENQEKEKEFGRLIEELENRLEQTNTKYHQIASQIENLRFTSQKLEQDITNNQQKYFAINTELERKEHQIEMSQERQNSINIQMKRIAEDVANQISQKDKISAEVNMKKQELQNIEGEFLEASDIVRELTATISQYKDNLSHNNLRLDEYKVQIIENLQEKATVGNELSKLDNEAALLARRFQQLKEKLFQLETSLAAGEEEAQELAEEQQACTFAKEQLDLFLAEQQEDLKKTGCLQDDLRQKIAAKQLEFQKIQSRYGVLEEMEETGDGYQQGVRAILAEIRNKSVKIKGIIGTVADIINVPPEFEAAVENALGGALQYIIAEHDQKAQEAITFLKREKKGRATFLPLNTIKARNINTKLDGPQVIGRAVELISFDKKYQELMEYLLGRIWIIKDLASAVAIGKKNGFNCRMVTPEGEIVTPGGALTGGTYHKNKTGILTRKRLLKELAQQIAAAENEINLLNNNMNSLEGKNKKLVVRIDEVKEDIHSHLIKIGDVNHKKEQVLKELKRFRDEEQLLHIEQAEILEQKESIETAKEKLLQEEQRLVLKNTEVEKEIAELQAHLKETAAAQEGLTENLHEKKIRAATLKRSNDLIKEQLLGLEQRISEIKENELKLVKEQEGLAREMDQLEENIRCCGEEIKESTRELQKLQTVIDGEKEQKISLQEQLAAGEKELKIKQTDIEQLREEVYQANMKLTKIQMEIKSSQDKLLEQFGYTLQEALNIKLTITNKRNTMKRISELKEYIADLGLVNFAAIAEFERVAQRLDFLAEQLRDLEEAQDSLVKVIKEMDLIMVKRFKETFALVNEAFNSVFIEMFGGGSASLELSDKDNLLETGIDIIAQPPGKKAQTLSLLSGGERAMTAIALLFAILRIKPSPFCVLDEIEAALDEANVDRFASFLKYYTDKTQFIIISHRKGTMEAADVLYGVTIEEAGVSKLISVKLSEAV
ncbi:MAG: chromosome segregation protein SMC [Peptococcaceae bacterium]